MAKNKKSVQFLLPKFPSNVCNNPDVSHLRKKGHLRFQHFKIRSGFCLPFIFIYVKFHLLFYHTVLRDPSHLALTFTILNILLLVWSLCLFRPFADLGSFRSNIKLYKSPLVGIQCENYPRFLTSRPSSFRQLYVCKDEYPQQLSLKPCCMSFGSLSSWISYINVPANLFRKKFLIRSWGISFFSVYSSSIYHIYPCVH